MTISPPGALSVPLIELESAVGHGVGRGQCQGAGGADLHGLIGAGDVSIEPIPPAVTLPSICRTLASQLSRVDHQLRAADRPDQVERATVSNDLVAPVGVVPVMPFTVPKPVMKRAFSTPPVRNRAASQGDVIGSCTETRQVPPLPTVRSVVPLES